MGLFDGLRQRRELERLEALVRDDPTPDVVATLTEKYISLDEVERALETARRGIRLFPRSSKIGQLYNYLKKSRSQARIAELKALLQTAPTPTLYAQLAEIYLDLEDTDKAVEVCRDAVVAFPNDDAAYLVIGEIRMARWREDFLARDGMLSVEHLEKATSLNPINYRAQRQLGEVCLEIGAVDRAIRRFKQVLEFAPEDPEVSHLLEHALAMPRPDRESIADLFRDVERAGRVPMISERMLTRRRRNTRAVKDERRGLDLEGLRLGLHELSHQPGFEAFVVVDPEGTTVLAEVAENAADRPHASACDRIARACQTAAQRMDIGRFNAGQIESAHGLVLLAAMEGYLLAAFWGPESRRMGALKGTFDELVARGFAGGPDAAEA